MSKDFDFTTEYTIDKRFYAECYDQTSRPIEFPKAYLKGMIFLLFGAVLVLFKLLPSGHVGWFFIVLSVIEACSLYFKRTWWLWRQTLSLSTGSKVVFEVDSNGVSYKNRKNTRTLAWSDIDQIEQSDLGLIFHIGKNRQYVSKSCLNDEAIAFILKQHAGSKKQ
ncbi:YcxB family protein [uncultured Vibrio sp.]|uniref:YcxB family protein n=1 Tax=uncultured Vibrio sp. TaxID=114054 RepID=UPI0025F5C2EB|nr:YcxB family protein [uncultured Vibrio sp.]